MTSSQLNLLHKYRAKITEKEKRKWMSIRNPFKKFHKCTMNIRNQCRKGLVNPLIATLKPQSNGPSCNNTLIGTLAVDGWAVTFGTARRGLGGAAARPGPSSLCQM